MINQEIINKIEEQLTKSGLITFLVGAGLSSESGIPTFRDKDGYWTEQSVNYTPEEMGTLKMFNTNSNQVWNWYLNRIQICKKAAPNKGHFAITDIQNLFPERFALISQNVDGLHFESGMNENQLYLIHGDLRFMRCSESCTDELFLIPNELINRGTKENLSFEETALIACPKCDDICRPHVLWFDEYYNEAFYCLNTVQEIAKETGLLFVIGTSGTTTMPKKILELAINKSCVIIDINPKNNLLTDKIIQSENGFWIKGKSGEILPFIVEKMREIKNKL